MEKNISFKLKIWRQRGPKEKGQFKVYEMKDIPTDTSFLEMLDILNEQLINAGEEPVVFDHDCREGIGICMLPVVFNAGFAATGDVQASADMMFRVLKSIAVPMVLGFVLCDGLAAISWIGMIMTGKLPLKKVFLIFNPLFIALLGNLMNLIAEGMDSGFESFGWLLMYLVCALKLADGKEKGQLNGLTNT